MPSLRTFLRLRVTMQYAPRVWGDPDPYEQGLKTEPEGETTLREAFAHDGPLFDEYDFGDGWLHRFDLIERGEMADVEAPVLLIKGERRGPYEDSGGVFDYLEKREVMSDSTHPDHRPIGASAREDVTWPLRRLRVPA